MIVGPLPPPTHGAARVTSSMCEAMEQAGITLRVHATSSTATGLAYLIDRLFRHVRAALTILLRRRKVSHVYIGGAGGQGLWFQAAVVLAARLARIRVLFHHHSYAYLNQRSLPMKTLVRLGGQHMRHVVLCADMESALEREYAPTGPIDGCSNAVMLAPVSSPSPDGGRATVLRLGHLSNLSMDKGLGSVLASVRACVDAGLHVELSIAGPALGQEELSVILRASEELGDRFRWLGPITSERLPEFMSSVDLFLFPSTYRHEAQPLVVLEAARAGVPTIAFDVGCLRSIIRDSRFLVSPDEDFAEAVVALVDAVLPDTRESTRAAFDDWYDDALVSRDELIATIKGEQQ